MKKLLTLITFLTLSGCAALFPGIQTGNTVADVDAFVTVASDISAWAGDAWLLLPPTVQASAIQGYTDVQNGLKTAIQLAEDGLAVYQQTNGGTVPNWAQIFANIEAAVNSVVSEIESLSSAGQGMVGPQHLKGDLGPSSLTGRITHLKNARATLLKFRYPGGNVATAPSK